MREHRRVTGRRQPRRLPLAAVVLVALAGVVTGSASEVDAFSTSQRGTQRHPATSSVDVPLVLRAHPQPPAAPRPGDPIAPEATRVAGAAAMPASPPVGLRIPSIGVDSALVDLGLQTDGSLEVPPGGFPAGWYTGAPTPGELGPAIIAGHVDWGGRPGVFFDLREVSQGDDIVITRQDGTTARFRVTRVEQFDKDAFPTRSVYGDLDHAGLRLITCGGSFDRDLRSYDDNLVVFAELVGSDAARTAAPGPDGR